uniref:ATP synthase subunit a n=1 Tax=Eophreatoicus karrkkanj TaxID=496899 RepID=D3U706_9CRUS|nr:ATP synthase F0 subunit 6 [Eophreatoicus sp. 14 FK-2009]ACN72764.1 ATP synthase F0 subunit 6 [Eophreatoicus karrkkanj]
MMLNLFTIFDPATGFVFSFNWISVLVGILFLPLVYWIVPYRSLLVFNSVTNKLKAEMELLLGVKSLFLIISLISFFFFIVMSNVMGLMPYIFTATSHLSLTLSLALPMWLGFILYGWVYNTKHMLVHMVPQGTPFVLMPFMVIIESISNIIRPITLSVRLAANMIAGHLLLALMGGSASVYLMKVSGLIVVGQLVLLVLESAVAVIQSYVFVVLMTLYLSEL